MKYLPLITINAVLLTACNSGNRKETEQTRQMPPTDSIATELPAPSTQSAIGYYVGDFEAVTYTNKKHPSLTNKINLSVDSMRGGTIYGHSIVAGNSRPFTGKYNYQEKVYLVTAKEPGDDQYDGQFMFLIDTVNANVTGTWTSNKADLSVTKRKYKLNKAWFSYQPGLMPDKEVAHKFISDKDMRIEEVDDREAELLTDDAVKFNASETLLKKEDIENMYYGDLELMRNTIYARHGYSFKNRRMRYIFDRYVDWYIPVSTDVRNTLTELEKKNIELIKRYEEHAEKYYDVFGR